MHVGSVQVYCRFVGRQDAGSHRPARCGGKDKTGRNGILPFPPSGPICCPRGATYSGTNRGAFCSSVLFALFLVTKKTRTHVGLQLTVQDAIYVEETAAGVRPLQDSICPFYSEREPCNLKRVLYNPYTNIRTHFLAHECIHNVHVCIK